MHIDLSVFDSKTAMVIWTYLSYGSEGQKEYWCGIHKKEEIGEDQGRFGRMV